MKIEECIFSYSLIGKDQRAILNPGEMKEIPGITLAFNEKRSGSGFRFTLTVDTKLPLDIKEISFRGRVKVSDSDTVFCNGFQSWTESREFRPGEKIGTLFPAARLFKVDRFGDYRFVKNPGRPGRFFSHNYTYLRDGFGTLRFAGSVSESAGYTLFNIDANTGAFIVSKECRGLVLKGRTAPLDVLVLFGPDDTVFDEYFKAVHPEKKPQHPATGWTSWYNYYTDINEEVILNNLDNFGKLGIPIDFFQIDDGFQTAVGDWMSVKPAFPRGMGFIAREIQRRGYRAGLWLAPFVCDARSDIFRNQKDWMLRDPKGNPIPAGWNPLWKGNFYSLDIYNRLVREYLKDVFATVLKKWKYDMVKLDFLYAVAQVPRMGRSRGVIMSDAMKFLRDCTGRKTVLGCGVPLGHAFGAVDYCRIGSDVAPKWEDRLLKAIGYRERVSTINSLRSTIGRRQLNGRAFVNDPDVFILRDEHNSLDKNQRHTLFMLNNIFGGLLFTSDNIARYSPETMRLYLSMFPYRKKEEIAVTENQGLVTIAFRIKDLSYMAFSNLGGKKIDAALDEGKYFGNDPGEKGSAFYSGYSGIRLEPYATKLFLKLSGEPYTIAGSTGHLFPGSEIDTLSTMRRRITVRLHRKSMNLDTVSVRVPERGEYVVNGISQRSEEAMSGLHIVTINL